MYLQGYRRIQITAEPGQTQPYLVLPVLDWAGNFLHVPVGTEFSIHDLVKIPLYHTSVHSHAQYLATVPPLFSTGQGLLNISCGDCRTVTAE